MGVLTVSGSVLLDEHKLCRNDTTTKLLSFQIIGKHYSSVSDTILPEKFFDLHMAILNLILLNLTSRRWRHFDWTWSSCLWPSNKSSIVCWCSWPLLPWTMTCLWISMWVSVIGLIVCLSLSVWEMVLLSHRRSLRMDLSCARLAFGREADKLVCWVS